MYVRYISASSSWITFISMNVEDNCRVYKGEDAFLQLPTSFRKSVRYEVRLGTGWDNYDVILLVSLLGHLRLPNITVWVVVTPF